MLTLILADSELEMVPESITGHPACVTYARKRGRPARQTLLDSTVHHPALQKVPDGGRRGRPDIVHFFLLTATDSILNSEGHLRVFVHTRNGQMIRIRPDIRLPKNQARFVALMEQLFIRGQVPPEGEPLMSIGKETLQEVLAEAKAEEVIVLSPQGRTVDPRRYFARKRDRNITCIIGGFPEGDFTSPVAGMADDVISISGHMLKVWTVASEILVNIRK
jgi:rRNA small subunit pseudouridine methyltransferase Nep1